jgi:hypothetical protein
MKHLLVLVLLLASPLHAAPANEAARAEAKRRFDKGLHYYDEGRYQDALLLYQSAYELYPSVSLLFNLALVREKVGDFEGCSLTFGQFLQQVGANDPDRERAVSGLERCHRQAKIPIRLTSLPAGAAVTVDGASYGRTPVVVELAPGPHQVAVVYPGYDGQEQRLVVEEGKHPNLDFALEKLSSLGIDSDVPGASVELDASKVGPAPVRREVRAGVYHVRVAHDGYRPVERDVSVAPGEQVSLMLSLPVLPQQRKVFVEAPRVSDAQVAIDGAMVGRAPLTRVVPSGAHHLEVRSPGHQSLVTEIDVPANGDFALRIEMPRLRSRATKAGLAGLLGVTVALAAIGGGFAIASTVDEVAYESRPSPALADRGHTEAVIADATLGIAAGTAVATLLWYVLTRPGPAHASRIFGASW